MNTPNRMLITIATLVASLGMAVQAGAHEPGKKMPASQQHPMTGHDQATGHGQMMGHDPMMGHEQSMAGMSEGSRQLHEAMMGGMRMQMPMKMTGNVDTDFATMMTMHHQQAIRMSDVLIRHGKNAELRALAQKMKASQLEEIRKMAPYTAKK